MVEIILEHIKKSLESGEDVLISGFGKFCVREKKEALTIIDVKPRLESGKNKWGLGFVFNELKYCFYIFLCST